MASFMDKIKKFVGNDDIEDEYDEYENDEVKSESVKSPLGQKYSKDGFSSKVTTEKNSNVVSMPNMSRFLISIREPITFDDGTQVLDDVLKGKVVVLNLEMLEVLLTHIKDDIEFRKFLEYPIIDDNVKKQILNVIYQDIKDVPVEVLNYLIEKKRLGNIKEIRDEYLNIYYEDHDKLIVTGIFAKELSQEQKEKLWTVERTPTNNNARPYLKSLLCQFSNQSIRKKT